MAAPAPKTKKELQSFLGKVNFLRRFISNLAGKIRPLSPLLKLKDAEQFIWGAEHQAAFDDIKKYLSQPPVLMPPKRGKPLRLYISASESSVGCLLAQNNEFEREQAVHYLSRTLNMAELNYSPIRAGVVIESPQGQRWQFAFQLDFRCTNNQAEYEALIIGLEILQGMKATRVLVYGDSQLANEMAQVASELASRPTTSTA
ncbi:unnamed protein product [Prunus brigantina]